MSTELTIANEMGMSLAEMMGFNTNAGGGTQSTLARITSVQAPIMGVVDVGGKKLKTEVIPVGAYMVEMPDETIVYAQEISLRIFAQRNQWIRWNSATNMMEKSVMASSLAGDLKDNIGSFNLGRPSGYIKDFKALPEKTQEVMRSVKKLRNFFGMATLIGAMDAEGNPVDLGKDEIPVVFDVKNRDSLKAIDEAVIAVGRRNLLPIMNPIILGGSTGTLPNGNVYAISTAKVGDKVDLKPEDNDTLRSFMDYITYVNSYILKKWDEAQEKKLSSEDADLVGQFVDMDGDDE